MFFVEMEYTFFRNAIYRTRFSLYTVVDRQSGLTVDLRALTSKERATLRAHFRRRTIVDLLVIRVNAQESDKFTINPPEVLEISRGGKKIDEETMSTAEDPISRPAFNARPSFAGSRFSRRVDRISSVCSRRVR